MTYKNIVIRWQTILLMKIDLQYDDGGVSKKKQSADGKAYNYWHEARGRG